MKRLRVLLLFVIIHASAESQMDYDNAIKKYYAQDLNSAIDLFSKCIQNNEKVALSYMYRGSAMAFLGRFDNAFKDLQTSLKLDSVNNKIYYYYGKVYLLKKEYNLAESYFKRSIKSKVDDPDRYDALATAQMFLGNYESAIDNENYAIRLDGSQSDYYLNRGFAKVKLQLFEDAILDLTKSLSIEKSYKAFSDRALAYMEIKMYSKALEDYNASLVIFPENAEALYFRGLVYKNLGKSAEACGDFKHSSGLGFAEATKMINSYCK